MPIYEYACGSCEHRFETIQKPSDGLLRDCPDCGEPALKKLLSAPVFRLKGSGWYETDFKTGDKKRLSDSGDAPAESKAGGENKGGDGKSESPSNSATSNGGTSDAKQPADKSVAAQDS